MGTTQPDIRPICYMVMPFRKKKVDEPRPVGAPAEIDFDALWERAYWPAIDQLGYIPMRADFDASSAIVKAMLERIAFANLVIADISLGNANCYYELGIRHVAQQTNCVLVGPDWSRPLFDIAQFASIRFPLTDGTIPPGEAQTIRDILIDKVPNVRDSRTPYYELIGDSLTDQARKNAFRDFALQMSRFQEGVRAIRIESDPVKQSSRLRAIIAGTTPASLGIPDVAKELAALVRDTLGWAETVTFIESLPPATRQLPWMREQYCLAVANAGDPTRAIAMLDQLIADLGDTPEREGLVGGRYKRLWRDTRKQRIALGGTAPSRDESQLLDKAIERYTRGMELDFNSYYCSSNLPALLRARDDDGDTKQATIIEHFVVAACERARKLGVGDEWLRSTLLGAAFRAGEIAHVQALVKDVEREGPLRWQLESTLADITDAVNNVADPTKRERLGALRDRLMQLNAQPAPIPA
jgi:tetratricopeptide repeat protein